MSGEKTEPPTPKRLKDARKKGQVCKSHDLTQACLFLTAALVIAAGGATYVRELRDLMLQFLQPSMLKGEVAHDVMLRQWGHAWVKFLLLSAPLLGALFIVSAAINYLQVQTLFAPDIIKPKFDKLNPIKNFQNIFFKARTYLELVKNLIKLTVILVLVYSTIKDALRDVMLTTRTTIPDTAMFAGTLMKALLYKVGGAFAVLGAADYMLQKKQYMKGLKMSKYEVEKEYKQDEGDPHIKHQRKALHEEMLHESAAEQVPKADVVVVNPTHLAVALQYDERTMNAPKVTAKGQNNMAGRIIDLAKKHLVPVMLNIGLAHSLFEVEVGRYIPEDLYEAVAEVLNWVYQLARVEER